MDQSPSKKKVESIESYQKFYLDFDGEEFETIIRKKIVAKYDIHVPTVISEMISQFVDITHYTKEQKFDFLIKNEESSLRKNVTNFIEKSIEKSNPMKTAVDQVPLCI